MKQKVWVVDDPHWNELSAKNRIEGPPPVARMADTQPLARSVQKSPALAFSLSMVAWGSGHIYSGAYGPGSIFLAAMLIFYSIVPISVFFPDSADRLVSAIDLPGSVFLAGGAMYLFIGLVFWLVNAVDAYFRTARLRSESFRGVDNPLWPPVCSICFPGWGQFLNGQPKKGIFFLLFGAAGFLAALIFAVTRYVWPLLKASAAGVVFEICLVAALMLMPLFLLMWIVAVYDAFRSCREKYLEKRRIPQTGYSFRKQKARQSLVPRGTVVLGLLLAISVGNQFFPKEFYRSSLERIRIETVNDKMEIIPELAGQAIELIDR